ncbi:hypothetical protein [Cognatiyoonia sp. IB215182]|uniref:hypothetical protein n=1 Tax=Cognatiyoonia sp. IB215182 TaxID=3097353 RepID=UPI002A0B4BCC|nr:hypothetical protein [Cognatiyoonia sp. IB215182]MDX8355781.1 hypothetical protein [Cognatiyoonia sp. IB215182]
MGWAAVFLVFVTIAAHLKRRTYLARVQLTLGFIFDGDLLTVALVEHAITKVTRLFNAIINDTIAELL